jgi:hypothetical protein
MHSRLNDDKNAFLEQQKCRHDEAAQCLALQLMAGLDLYKVLQAGREQQSIVVLRLSRLIERERLKGLNRHWSYDINRHIALTQARDRLKSQIELAL